MVEAVSIRFREETGRLRKTDFQPGETPRLSIRSRRSGEKSGLDEVKKNKHHGPTVYTKELEARFGLEFSSSSSGVRRPVIFSNFSLSAWYVLNWEGSTNADNDFRW